MKNVEVSAAIIIKNNKIFITQRGYGEFKDYWEFPGGKIEYGEDEKNALLREIKEELNAHIKIIEKLCVIEYTYPTFKLKMHCFISYLLDEYTLLEHEAAKFINIEDLDKINFLPADLLIISKLKAYLINKTSGQ